CRSDRSALLAPAPETGGSWLAAGCASISRWNAKIRPTHHARSRRLGADVGARRTAPPGSTAPRQLTYGPLYALSAAATGLFDALDKLERRLADRRYLTGATITEADWRLFTTLVRFDPVYFGHFKCNKRRIVDYPNLSGYLR